MAIANKKRWTRETSIHVKITVDNTVVPSIHVKIITVDNMLNVTVVPIIHVKITVGNTLQHSYVKEPEFPSNDSPFKFNRCPLH